MTSTLDLVQLLTLIAHELRTPLTVTAGYLKMLESERAGPLTAMQRKAVTSAERACGQLLELASDVSFLARLERGDAMLNRHPVPVSRLLTDAVTACSQRAHASAAIELSGDDDGIVTVDPIRMRHALQWLILSVARTVPEGMAVTVSRQLRTGGGGPRMVIAIGSPGQAVNFATIDHHHLEPLDEWEGGLGVGLPLARRIIDLEGGEVRSLDTTPPGLVVVLPTAVEHGRVSSAGA